MSNTTTTWHSIREASMISGLPESTLRYYEQIGIIDPIARDPSSGHRVYSDKDIESLTTIACLAATGMPLESMREYLKNRFDGPEGARRQIELLDANRCVWPRKPRPCASSRRTVSLKSLYWRAIAEGHEDEANRILEENKDVIENDQEQPGRARSHA